MALKLGIIIGSISFDLKQVDNFMEQELVTGYGTVSVYESDHFVMVPRHGKTCTIPPHKVNHHANISALETLGVETVIGFNSVGSLKPDLKPPTLVVPDDYINLRNIPTFFDNKIVHITPGLDTGLCEKLHQIITKLELPGVKGGTYIQTVGPRLETKAEIKMLRNYGDIVGMTMASEATLAKEKKLQYANISAVDNFCNGITAAPLDFDTIKATHEKNAQNIINILQALKE